MGLSYAVFDRLLAYKARGLLDHVKTIAELGAQNIYADQPAIAAFLDRWGCPGDATLVAARDLYTRMGLACTSIDTSGEFGAIPLDLNFDCVPAEHVGRFDLVTNHGTTEHIFNQLNCFEAIHDLTKVGGLILHNVPFTGHQNHGLFNYTPKLFWMLARGNGYEYLDMHIVTSGQDDPLHSDIKGMATHDAKFLGTRDSVIFCLLRKVSDAPFILPFDGHMDGLPKARRKAYGTWQERPSLLRHATDWVRGRLR
jgi:hypothetical protein